MEELLSFLNFIATSEGWPLSTACLEFLPTIIKEKTVKKGEYLLKTGQVCKNLYFIKKGLLKCYYILHEKEVCDWFFAENEIVVSIDSFYDQKKSEDYIQALEDSYLFYISFQEFQYLYRTYVEFNVVGRVLTNKYLRIWHRQARNIRMLNARERLLFFLENQPDLSMRVPVRDQASFLAMTQETLSRTRGSI